MLWDDLEYPFDRGDVLELEHEDGVVVVIKAVDHSSDTGEPLYQIEIDGLVTWSDLEALARRLHPKGISAVTHAQEVREAEGRWREPSTSSGGTDDEA